MAKAQAQWGKHKFLISSNQLNPMGDFSTSSEAKASDSKSKKKKTELETYTLTETCHSAAGADPVAHYNAWRADIGNYNSLYMNGKKWKSNPLKLQKVSLGSVKQDDFGRIRYGCDGSSQRCDDVFMEFCVHLCTFPRFLSCCLADLFGI